MHRFFLESEDVKREGQIELYNVETVAHIAKVLRVKPGEMLEIVDSESTMICEVVSINPTSVKMYLREIKAHENESIVEIDLFQCLPKGQKLELILQKNVELGVSAFHLVQSKRCIVDYKPKDTPKKMERLNKIIKEAAKQSKRDRIPTLEGILSIKEVAKCIGLYDAFIVLYEREGAQSLKKLLAAFKGKKLALLIGPEGGLDSDEVDLLTDAGAISTTLGNRILRTETAGFVAVTCVQYETGALE